MADMAYYRKCAVERAEAELSAGKDWQDVQFVLFNNPLYTMLFSSLSDDGPISDEDGEESMSIIREAESNLSWN